MPSKLHFKEIDFVIYFPATGNENRDLKKYGVLTLRDLGPTSRIFSSSPCRIQFTVLYLHPLRGNTQNPAASLSTPKPLWRPKHLKSFRSPPPARDPPITQILHPYIKLQQFQPDSQIPLMIRRDAPEPVLTRDRNNRVILNEPEDLLQPRPNKRLTAVYISDCRNRNLQKMFQLIGLGEQAGSGFPKIYRNWNLQHWREPVLEERYESNQTVFILKMISLVPEEAVEELKAEIGDAFSELGEVERLALVTARCEGCVNHGRLKEVTKEHPHDITVALHGLVEKGLLMSEGSGRSTFYYRPGRHPMEGEMFGAPGICSKPSSEHLPGSSEHLPESFEHLIASSKHLDTLREIARPVGSVRKASRKVVEATILRLCEGRYLTLDDLADLLNRSKDSLRNHYINPMLEDGRIEAKYKNVPTHPLQGYRTVAGTENEE